MATCPNCGHTVNNRAKFCETCGSALLASEMNMAVSSPPSVKVGTGQGSYGVMLLSSDKCSQEMAVKAIEEICGYSDDEALAIIGNTPIAIARNLSQREAVLLARKLNESGVELSVYGSNGYIESAPHFDGAPAGLLSGKNRIDKYLIRPWNYPYAFTGDKPPVFK